MFLLFSFPAVLDFDLLLTISGVWSLVILVYVIPLMKDEYNPELEQSKLTKVQETAGGWKYSILRGYRSNISRDYGSVYENEFQKHGARMARIRVVLSGLLLLPIAFALFSIPPLAALSLILWFRMFSLDHTHFSDFERGLLTLTTLSVAILITITFFQPELIGFISFFDAVYGFGLLSGIGLLFLIML